MNCKKSSINWVSFENTFVTRRQMLLEENASGASNVNVNMAAMSQPAPNQPEDPVAKLSKLKTMLDQELITSEEFQAAKQKILGNM